MKSAVLRFLLALALLVLLCVLGVRGVGGMPAVGALLDPVSGLWSDVRRAQLPDSAAATIPGLTGPVRVLYDDRSVPHIYATTEADAIRALGYVVARDRLFQLELQTRAASGRLTELVGPAALAADRNARALGLPRAAELAAAEMQPGSDAARMTAAFADGVNAYIGTLSPDEYPVEFRLLGKAPAKWEPINSQLLFGRMGLTLAYSSLEFVRLRARALIGAEAASALYPVVSPIQEPIVPNGQDAPRYDLTPLPPPGQPDTAAQNALALLRTARPAMFGSSAQEPTDALGSNNWAVAPARSASGAALLEGDPHLDLTLPSIWYEAHMVVPGRLNAYGVTIPGAPSIIIGFNQNVAWTFTNTGADVLDYWAETVDDSLSPESYLVDGEWLPVTQRIEEYRGKAGELLATDTLRFTHRGPLRRLGGRWLSMRWTVLEAPAVAEPFLRGERAASVAEWMDAMSAYRAPAQNMLVADRSGHIAIRSTGWFPIRAGDGDGTRILDGSTSDNDWRGYWPVSQYPQSTDPPQGYLASANQQPLDPRVDERYLAADWFSPWRALEINRLLRADESVTVDEMRRYQTDPGSARADVFVPLLLDCASRIADDSVARAASLLAEWDRRYTFDNRRAVLFEYIMDALRWNVWDELDPGSTSQLRPPHLPGDMALLTLLHDESSAWWDVPGTDNVEHRDQVVARAMREALARAVRLHGDPSGDGWKWSEIRTQSIRSLSGIDGWSRNGIKSQGGTSTINPVDGSSFGPSWRMVVELGPTVRAWGTYPGGQSGDPASPRYDDRIATWSAGELDTLRFPAAPDSLADSLVRSRLTLTPELD